MTSQEFINTICEYYLESRELSIDRKVHNIWRGVSHSISSKAEDLFALYIAENLNDNSLEYIVDKTFSFKGSLGKTVTFRPDLAIVKGSTITHIFDLKMDMGYKRRYFETERFSKSGEMFTTLRDGKVEEISYRINKKSKRVLNISNQIINQIVVLSEKNGGKASNRLEMIENINGLDWVNLYYLTKEIHPNNYDGDSPVLNQSEFKRLFRDIKEQLT
ncbi:MAG: hypothetical protein ABJK11_14840 [Balneola sp.]